MGGVDSRQLAQVGSAFAELTMLKQQTERTSTSTTIMDVDVGHAGAPKPHDDLWFPDGNVVLETDTYLFKVHRGILSLQSSVFRDMFELPTIDGLQDGRNIAGIVPELYEGLPLVRLIGEKGEELADLLQAVYDRQCMSTIKSSY